MNKRIKKLRKEINKVLSELKEDESIFILINKCKSIKTDEQEGEIEGTMYYGHINTSPLEIAVAILNFVRNNKEVMEAIEAIDLYKSTYEK